MNQCHVVNSKEIEAVISIFPVIHNLYLGIRTDAKTLISMELHRSYILVTENWSQPLGWVKKCCTLCSSWLYVPSISSLSIQKAMHSILVLYDAFRHFKHFFVYFFKFTFKMFAICFNTREVCTSVYWGTKKMNKKE